MFFDILWIAFIVELIAGIIIGWVFSSYFPWGKNSSAHFALGENTNGSFASAKNNPDDNSQSNGSIWVNPESPSQTDTDLTQIKSENETLRNQLAKEQNWRESLESQVERYKIEIAKMIDLAKTLESQVARYKHEAARAQATAQALQAKTNKN